MNRFRQNLSDARFITRLERALSRLRLDPTDAGLNATLTNTLPRPSTSNDWLYTSEAGDSFRCPAADVRVYCGSGVGDAGNYTETTAIGIAVHEVRVATRVPNS